MDLTVCGKSIHVIWTVLRAKLVQYLLLATQACTQVRLASAELIFDIFGYMLVASMVIAIKLRSRCILGEQRTLAPGHTNKTGRDENRRLERVPGGPTES